MTRVGTTLAALNAGGTPADGELGILRLGTWPNLHEEYLYWVSGSPGRWLGEEKIVATQGDTWAMDLGNRSGTDLVNWTRIMQAIPYGKSYTVTVGSQNVSAIGTLNVAETRPANGTTILGKSKGFTTTGRLVVRDNLLEYTGKTNTSFTGVTFLAGSGGTIPAGVDVLWGFPGGYGFVCVPVMFANDLWATGLRLQEKAICLMNDEPGMAHQLNVAPYWREFNSGDGDTESEYAVGGMGLSAQLRQATAADGGDKINERSFHWTENAWADWAAGTPTKRYLMPTIMGKMDAGAFDTGQVLDYRLAVRWRS